MDIFLLVLFIKENLKIWKTIIAKRFIYENNILNKSLHSTFNNLLKLMIKIY